MLCTDWQITWKQWNHHWSFGLQLWLLDLTLLGLKWNNSCVNHYQLCFGSVYDTLGIREKTYFLFGRGWRGAVLPWQHKRVSQQLVPVWEADWLRGRQRGRQQGRKGHECVSVCVSVCFSVCLCECESETHHLRSPWRWCGGCCPGKCPAPRPPGAALHEARSAPTAPSHRGVLSGYLWWVGRRGLKGQTPGLLRLALIYKNLL